MNVKIITNTYFCFYETLYNLYGRIDPSPNKCFTKQRPGIINLWLVRGGVTLKKNRKMSEL